MPGFSEIKQVYETKVVSDAIDTNDNDIVDKNEVQKLQEKLQNSKKELQKLNTGMKDQLIPALQAIDGTDKPAATELISKVKTTIVNIEQYLDGTNSDTNAENGNNNHGNKQGENHNDGNTTNSSPHQNQNSGEIPEGIQLTTNINKATGGTNANIAYGNTTKKGNKFFSTVGVGTKRESSSGETQGISGESISGEGKNKINNVNFGFGVNTSGNVKKQKQRITRQGEIDQKKLEVGDTVNDLARDLKLNTLGELQGKITKLTIKLKAAKNSLQKFEKTHKTEIDNITNDWLESEEGEEYLNLSAKVDEIQGTIQATKKMLQKESGN